VLAYINQNKKFCKSIWQNCNDLRMFWKRKLEIFWAKGKGRGDPPRPLGVEGVTRPGGGEGAEEKWSGKISPVAERGLPWQEVPPRHLQYNHLKTFVKRKFDFLLNHHLLCLSKVFKQTKIINCPHFNQTPNKNYKFCPISTKYRTTLSTIALTPDKNRQNCPVLSDGYTTP